MCCLLSFSSVTESKLHMNLFSLPFGLWRVIIQDAWNGQKSNELQFANITHPDLLALRWRVRLCVTWSDMVKRIVYILIHWNFSCAALVCYFMKVGFNTIRYFQAVQVNELNCCYIVQFPKNTVKVL